MPTTSELQAVVGPMLRVNPDDVSGSTSLKQFSSSLERVKLESGLKKIGLLLPSGSVGPTFSDLVRQVGLQGGSEAPLPVAAGPSIPVFSQGVELVSGIGCDLECVSAIPVANDPWEDAFYRETFTDVEIARCLVEAEPRVHFAGIWSAKEAFKKSRPGFESIRWNSMQVVHDERGAPRMEILRDGQVTRLPCLVTISHTGDHAMAVVAWIQTPMPVSVVAPATTPAPTPAPGGAGTRSLVMLAALLASAAFLLSLYTAVRH